ncbi:MAG TPA: hydantoinase/oxoprolinase family protein, partial [Thermomicrobiales bacterium]|nr:hydantoinase/oxoprolinase family protein [Thermomicrobiales bacterium]
DGAMTLDAARAEETLRRSAAEPLGLDLADAAEAVVAVANANMADAIRLISVRRGYDPRDFTLIAFGGGGAMHAAALAKELHVGRVLIPQAPGHFSAWGMLMTDPTQDFIRTTLVASNEEHRPRIDELFGGMEVEARRFFADAGYGAGNTRIERFLDMRYHGQEHTVRVPVASGADGAVDVAGSNERFHGLHERAYTYRLDSAIEIVNFHVVGSVPTRKPELASFAVEQGDGRMKARRTIDYDEWGHLDSAIYERGNLRPDIPIHGPAVIEEPAATTVVYPGMTAQVDKIGNILIETQASSS